MNELWAVVTKERDDEYLKGRVGFVGISVREDGYLWCFDTENHAWQMWRALRMKGKECGEGILHVRQ